MRAVSRYLKQNALGAIAIFIALGGTGYAAVAIPNSSVGTRQLRNGAVTPRKLDAGLAGGYVRAWAGIGAGGKLMVSGGKVKVGGDGPGAWVIFWPGGRQDDNCRVIGAIDAHLQVHEQPGFVLSGTPFDGSSVVQIYNAQAQPAYLPFDIELLCPTPR